jgi:hypothetical protein
MMKRPILIFLAVALTAAFAQAELLLYYNFEETPGGTTVIDQSLNSFNGILEYGYPDSSTALPEYITSHDGSQALLFGYDSGVAGAGWNNIDVGYDPALARIGQQWSMSFWARQDDNVLDWSGGYPRIISSPNYEIELGAAGDMNTYFWPWEADPPWGDPASWDFTMGPSPDLGVWFHMAVTYDGETFRQYIDGDEVFTRSGMGEFVESTWEDIFPDATLRIGAQSWIDKSYLVGALDDVAIWSHCYLDADAVAGLFDGTYDPSNAPTVPEPATLMLLAAGGLLARRKR